MERRLNKMSDQKVYSITIRQTFRWDIPIKALSKKEALEKAKLYFEHCNDDYTGVADTHTVEKTAISITNDAELEYSEEEIGNVENHFQEILKENPFLD
jgi:hypothetical protein